MRHATKYIQLSKVGDILGVASSLRNGVLGVQCAKAYAGGGSLRSDQSSGRDGRGGGGVDDWEISQFFIYSHLISKCYIK